MDGKDNNMGIEFIISIIGVMVIMYFSCRPEPAKKKKDKLTKEIQVKGLPPQAPWNSWIPPQ
jgi:preprotein translocase subunit YajC